MKGVVRVERIKNIMSSGQAAASQQESSSSSSSAILIHHAEVQAVHHRYWKCTRILRALIRQLICFEDEIGVARV